MATNLQHARDFQRRLGDLAVRVEGNAHKALRRAALAIDQTLVLATPVDTGRARANWVATLNAPAEGLASFTPPAPGDRGKPKQVSGANTNAALAQANAIIGSSLNDDAIWLTNNLPYIERLNEGSSPQAPGGMFVETAVKAGAESVKGVRLLEAVR